MLHKETNYYHSYAPLTFLCTIAMHHKTHAPQEKQANKSLLCTIAMHQQKHHADEAHDKNDGAQI